MSTLPRPAQYLLRVDDLCPTMASAPRRKIVALIEEFHLQPILAIVPDNRDPELAEEPADYEFWEQLRGLQAGGAAIGLHGYRHLCLSEGRGLLKLASQSEFAGVAEDQQRVWIHDGVQILRRNGLDPQVWVAPRHGFDLTTLRILRAEGIRILSDGLTRMPFTRGGLVWIPQQLWAPVEKREGLWTICLHPNTISDTAIEALRLFLRTHAAQFTSVDRVMREFPQQPLKLSERLYAGVALWRIQMRREVGGKFSLSRCKAPPTDSTRLRD